MIVALRKFLFLVLMVLALLAGTLGLSVRAMTAPSTQFHHTSIQFTPSGPRVVCPPPPYIC